MNTKRNVRVSGSADYRPWPELNHAARSLRRMAREEAGFRLHLMTGSLVLTAMAIEAFCATVGPKALPEAWHHGRAPVFRKPLARQLELIGAGVGVFVDFDQEPWTSVRQLLEARSDLLVPKPGLGVDEVLSVDEDADARFDVHMAVQAQHRTLHGIADLERVAGEVNRGLLNLWDAVGGDELALNVLEVAQWTVTEVQGGGQP